MRRVRDKLDEFSQKGGSMNSFKRRVLQSLLQRKLTGKEVARQVGSYGSYPKERSIIPDSCDLLLIIPSDSPPISMDILLGKKEEE